MAPRKRTKLHKGHIAAISLAEVDAICDEDESLLVDVEARQVLEKGPDALPMLANAMDRQKRQNMSQVAMDYVRMNKANREEMSEFLTRRNMINSM